MTSDSRDLHMRRQKGQALVRALHISELEAAGAARKAALQQADEELARIGRLLPDALASGISISEVARITDVSRPTLYELRARHSANKGDLAFGVLQAIAARGPVDRSGLAELFQRPVAEIKAVVDNFEEQGMLWEEFNEDQDNPMMELILTDKGLSVLEVWEFSDDAAEEGAEP